MEDHGPRLAAQSDPVGLAYRLGHLVRLVHPHHGLHQRLRHGLLGDGLVQEPPGGAVRGLADQVQQRHRVQPRLGEPREGVGEAGPGDGHQHADPSRGPGVAVGHERGAELVRREHRRQGAGPEGFIELDVLGPGKPEHVAHAQLLQRAAEDLATAQLGAHPESPRSQGPDYAARRTPSASQQPRPGLGPAPARAGCRLQLQGQRQVAAELALEAGHRIQARVGEVHARVAPLGQRLEGAPAQEGVRAQRRVLLVGGRGDDVRHRNRSQQHQLGGHRPPVREPRVIEGGELLPPGRFDEGAKGLPWQVGVPILAVHGGLVKAVEALEVVVFRDGEPLLLGPAHQPPRVLLHALPRGFHVVERHHVAVGGKRRPSPGEEGAHVGQPRKTLESDAVQSRRLQPLRHGPHDLQIAGGALRGITRVVATQDGPVVVEEKTGRGHASAGPVLVVEGEATGELLTTIDPQHAEPAAGGGAEGVQVSGQGVRTAFRALGHERGPQVVVALGNQRRGDLGCHTVGRVSWRVAVRADDARGRR